MSADLRGDPPASPVAPLAWLDRLLSFERTGALTAPTTATVDSLVAALGDPHLRYPVIHVTGTNGKGSTTAMIAALLTGSGLRVGTYTSPHLQRLTERVTVAGEEVDADDLATALGEVARVAQALELEPTWFEAMTAAGLWLLAAQRVDVAVVEVGMLGRWDATNIVHGTVAVVTNVDLDHTDLAGPTRSDVATEKAGIVEPGSTLVLGEDDPALRGVFTDRSPGRVLTRGRELTSCTRSSGGATTTVDLTNPWGTHLGVVVPMTGAHQVDNALVALSAAESFLGRRIDPAAVTEAFSQARLSGRFEIVGRYPAVVVDGAHNPAAAAALRRTLAETFPEVARTVLVYGALAGRDPARFLDRLGVRTVDLLITTEPDSPRAVSAHVLAEVGRSLGVATTAVIRPDHALAVAIAAAGPDGLVVATGSLHLVAAVRDAAASVTP